MKTKICKSCSKSFRSKSKRIRYCSRRCKNRYSRSKRALTSDERVKVKKLKQRACEICKWEKASRDIHHIVPIKDGGTNEVTNLITLCPNHHRMADRGMIPIKQQYVLIQKRKEEIGL